MHTCMLSVGMYPAPPPAKVQGQVCSSGSKRACRLHAASRLGWCTLLQRVLAHPCIRMCVPTHMCAPPEGVSGAASDSRDTSGGP